MMGGSKENRHTPGLEHWSIAVKDGKALEKEWRSEIPIPRGGPHRLFFTTLLKSVVVNPYSYIIHHLPFYLSLTVLVTVEHVW